MADKVSKFIFPVKTGNTIADKEFDLPSGSDGNTFVGTTAEWEALTTEQQNTYDCRVLTDDDLDTKNVIDNLTSDSSTDALSAKQGKVLKGLVDAAQTSADIAQAQVSDSDDAYDPTKPYKVGDLCIHDDKLYRCTTACSAGSWTTNQSCFTQDTLVNVANGLNSELNVVDVSDDFVASSNVNSVISKSVKKVGNIIVGSIVFLPIAIANIQNKEFFRVNSEYKPKNNISFLTGIVKDRTSASSTTELVTLTLYSSDGVLGTPNRGGYGNVGAVTTNSEFTLSFAYTL